MKKKIFKFILAAATVAFICNCGDEVSGAPDNNDAKSYIVAEPSFLFSSNGVDYIISASGVVTNEAGEVVGAADIATGTIIAMDQSIIGQGIDFTQLTIINPTIIVDNAWVLSADKNYVIYPSGLVTDAAGTPIGTIVYNNPDAPTVGSIISNDNSVLIENVDVSTLKVYAPNVQPLPVSSSSAIPSQGSSAVEGYPNPLSSSEITPLSSSSKIRSSSSSVRSSSSSVKSSSSSQGSISFTIKYVSGGKSGSGYATRYWDCCKPHCAWPDKGGPKAKTCDASGNTINDDGASSMCDGGNAGICRGQFPIVVNDTLAFAFAATPGGENNCGKCFDLAFNGTGKYATDANHKKLKGKHLIVMSNNVGYDVAGGQFDVMIPGGGYGIFNGCSAKMGWGSQGAQYGGLLTECEESSGYNASTYKSCLTQKCNSSFANDAKAKEGCLFMANWMEAAGNPNHNYKEVECPKELLDRY